MPIKVVVALDDEVRRTLTDLGHHRLPAADLLHKFQEWQENGKHEFDEKSLLSPRLRKMTTKQFRRYLEDREKGHQKKLAALEKKLDRRRQEIFNTIFKIFRP